MLFPLGMGTHSVDRMGRGLYSADGTYFIGMDVIVLGTPAEANEAMAKYELQSNGPWTAGSFSGAPIGDRAWCVRFNGASSMMFVLGRTFVQVNCGPSNRAAREQVKAEFPPEAVEAIAETILLRISRVASIAGKGSGSAAVAVNGQPLPGRATLVSGQPKVPVADVAKLAGWKVAWDAKTGKVTLSRGGRTVNLAAGSMSATVGGEAKQVALKSPVLKDGGQPVMDLTELVGLLGGKVVEKTAERVSVRI